ncbi:NADP-dependent phosphogluconate dehydrogenase [Cognatishimia sp. F0-27]|uniref:NADP-dependent phosphogluconate dehydrogenase n=1 Tax=Cognatishimia sp. F0-27 TaxID=2816855 RepID=UPI001D0CA185|nr:NADP-dependent phosphogluconate dehydrogenase [Cognatishimia sp. F0-27]MCC1491958.1 NADP-dependent phosphogluconate dehydrogenase [Cognatishimia sp. F0-27]
MTNSTPLIGLYGLGTMGSALALNMADHGIAVAVSNRSADAIDAFVEEAGPLAARITPSADLDALIAALPTPRLLLAMIPSTGPMDGFLDAVIPKLAKGDTVIDAGNADFHDTRRRASRLDEHGLHFVGLGVSGGEEGARHGPSMMMGGSEQSWARLEPILTAIAARYDGAPCVARLGPDGAGHFVKTVHNGIEYADMQMLAEVTEILRHGGGWSTKRIASLLDDWNAGPLESYLTEITAKILRYDDPDTGGPAVDTILDRAGQKGTGRWTVIEAVKLGQSATLIEAAVAGRAWSSEKALREAMESRFGKERAPMEIDAAALERAVLAARVLEYAQGFRILGAASEHYGWALDPARIAEIWRAGCIIRARLLDDISAAFAEDPPMGQIVLSAHFEQTLKSGVPALRSVVSQAQGAGYAVPVLSAALGFWDTMRQGRGTAHIIQAQRDFFGRHGFDRIDGTGPHHGPWWD